MKKIYTIATAHLDTCWLWTQEDTINNYIKPSFINNFKLADKYPDYRFNFEGSYRYELLNEYYPDIFSKLTDYVAKGKFNVTGSAFENGDVNIVSPESLIRNILYGNTYFYNNFGKKSNDIYLPDCFGFGKALPTVARHCNLKGFTTQKLTWGSANGRPFELGKWVGNDNKPIYVSVDGGDYGTILKDVRTSYNEKIAKNAKNGLEATMVFHGTGDRGGSPHVNSVKELEKAIKENDDNLVVLSSTPTELFNDLEKYDLENPGKLPVMEDEYLLTTHGVGSYTSRTQTKRFNKKCEALADVSERANTLSYLLGHEYPVDRFNFAWKKILQHHFHDDITGTSFMECYKRSYNDYIQALNTLEDEYVNAINNIDSLIDTSNVKGTPIYFFNGSQDDITCNAKVAIKGLNNKNVKVINKDGIEVVSQVNGDILTVNDTFKGNTISLYDVVEEKSEIKSKLSYKDKVLENQKYRITFNENYEIASIIDKKLDKELLASPICYDLLADTHSIDWPSWEIKYEDIIKEPIGKASFKDVKVLEEGNAYISLEITRTYNKTTFKEIISLANNSDRIDVFNEVDWREEATDLKVRFDLTSSNPNANYDIGFFAYQRGNNAPNRYEVPAQKFADITNIDESYGISILTDSKTGWDKPNDNTLRLTAIHTPLGNFRYETSQHLQDLGINRFTYSIYSHAGKCEKTIKEADNLNKLVQGFTTTKHTGTYKNEITLASINKDNVRILAIKKALETSHVIVRVSEYTGKKTTNVKIDFVSKIKEAFECYGDEVDIKEVDVSNGLIFDLEPYEVKSFKLAFDIKENKKDEIPVVLPYNKVGITSNNNRKEANLAYKISLAKEILNHTIYTNGVKYLLNSDELVNVVECQGQEIEVQKGYKYANLLVLNIDKDREVVINGNKYFVQSSFALLGCWDLIGLHETGFIKEGHQAYSMSHYHHKNKDEVGQNVYLYTIKVPVINNKVVLPDDKHLVIVAMTLNNKEVNVYSGIKMFDSLKKRPFDYTFSKYAIKKSSKPTYQKVLDLFTNRKKAFRLIFNNGYTTQSLSDGYLLVDMEDTKKYAKKINAKEEN